MREEIETGFRLNLQRVRKLVQLYRDLAGSGPGRRPVETTDVLRSSVVFLHAALEDFLRSLLVRRWSGASDPSVFDDVPIAIRADTRSTRVTLAELASMRGKTVDEVVQLSLEAHLERATFNHVGDVKTALVRAGIGVAAVAPRASELAALMSRRHQIVHRADRLDVPGRGKLAAASLSVATVEVWVAAVDAVCRGIVAEL